MAYDAEEQEQIDTIKDWWKENGKLVILGVIACALTIGAFQGWRYYQAQQAERAGVLFSQLDQAERAGDAKKVRAIGAQITSNYDSTLYAGMAALSAAKASFLTGELEEAKKTLQWAVDKAREEELRDVARLRLAGILLDEKKHDDALKLLATKPRDAYAALYEDLKGDVLAAQGKAEEARAAYRLALQKSDQSGSYRQLIELKLDSLGEAK